MVTSVALNHPFLKHLSRPIRLMTRSGMPSRGGMKSTSSTVPVAASKVVTRTSEPLRYRRVTRTAGPFGAMSHLPCSGPPRRAAKQSKRPSRTEANTANQSIRRARRGRPSRNRRRERNPRSAAARFADQQWERCPFASVLPKSMPLIRLLDPLHRRRHRSYMNSRERLSSREIMVKQLRGWLAMRRLSAGMGRVCVADTETRNC
jgi:hypothetical protein